MFPPIITLESHGGRGGRGRGDRDEAWPPSSADSSFQPHSPHRKDVKAARLTCDVPLFNSLVTLNDFFNLPSHYRKLDVDHLYMSYADIMAKVRQSGAWTHRLEMSVVSFGHDINITGKLNTWRHEWKETSQVCECKQHLWFQQLGLSHNANVPSQLYFLIFLCSS